MSKFEEAYYITYRNYISIKEYEDKKHKDRILCPECHLAPLHIKRKQKSTFFSSNRKENHSKNCQHFENFIPNRNLNKLIISKEIKDKERLFFLIDNNLNGALNLMIKNSSKDNKNSIITEEKDNSKERPKNSLKKYKKESIIRVSIKNLTKNIESLIGNYIVIWGIADITIKDAKFGKQILFRNTNNIKFSIFLSNKQLSHTPKLMRENKSIGFAVFGKLVLKNNFLNLQIMYGQHIQILTNE